MTIRSSVPTVVDAVLALFGTAVTGQSDAQGGSVQVVDGELGTFVADEYVQVLGARYRQESATVDGSRRNETVDVECMARVYQGGDDQAGTRTRAFALVALIETGLENDPSLGGVSNGRAQMASGEYRGGVTDTGGRASEVDFTITVVTQLINA